VTVLGSLAEFERKFIRTRTSERRARPWRLTTGVAPANETISAADFVNNIVTRNMFDVQAARLAEQKGDQSDKTFAQREISNHTRMTDDLKSIVNSQKVNANIPTSLTSECQQRIDRLQKRSGKQFDEAYGNEELRNHENLTALFELCQERRQQRTQAVGIEDSSRSEAAIERGREAQVGRGIIDGTHLDVVASRHAVWLAR
jgi:predicted outer membrane protein